MCECVNVSVKNRERERERERERGWRVKERDLARLTFPLPAFDIHPNLIFCVRDWDKILLWVSE